MARLHMGHLICFWLPWAVSAAHAADVQRTPRELIQYVEDAQKLGLKENDIRQNAVTAGWNREMVGEALAIVRYLNEAPTHLKGSRPVAEEPPRKPSAVEPAGYRIGAGDVLQILVWKEPEASVSSVVVRTDGKITVPFVKEIEVAGMTPAELEKILAGKFTKYIRDLDVTSVTVVPKEILSQKVYLLGAVKKEGPVPLKSSMTVLQALNEAGGLTEYAKRKKIYVLRNDGGKQIRLPFDYTAVIRGERPEQNILVRAEDTVVVP
jgi:polysaccharide export outer membrane protein